MSNPFKMLDLSDDENITIVKKPEAAPKPAKPPAKNRAELKKEEIALQQKKKGPPGQRGSHPQPSNVTHPGERSKIGLKKEPHVNTHPRVDPAAPANSRGGRVFDRHSGTGRGKEIKKQGAGGHNWGKPGVDEAPPATPSKEGEEKKEGEAAADAPPAVVEEPQMTLEEFEAAKQAKRSGDAFKLKEARKVEAPELAVLKKDETEDFIKLGAAEPHENKKKPGHFKAKPAKQVMEIDFKIAREAEPESRPSSSRGFGRGRGGPSAPRGSPREARPPRGGRGGSAQAPVDVTDDSAFPKLGATGA